MTYLLDKDLLEVDSELVDELTFDHWEHVASPGIPRGCRKLMTAAVKVAPFRYICSVTANKANAVVGGSGTLIGNRTVLCAAHTVFKSQHTPSNVKVNFGIPNASKTSLRFSIGSSVVDAIKIFPKFIDLEMQGTNFDIAILKLKTSMQTKVKGYWGKIVRPSFDSRGSQIGSLPDWRPGKFKVNFSGYPQVFSGSQLHCFTSTLPSIAGSSLLSFRSIALLGLSGSPVWVTRHRSLGGRHLFGMVVSLDIHSGEIDAVHFSKPGNRDVVRFIKGHAPRSARFSF